MKKRHSASQIRIGTRGSPLALAQASEVAARLSEAHAGDVDFEICVIKTSGDKIQDRALITAGGKGLFTKELEEALIDGGIDLAVHSMKDMPAILPRGLDIACILPREDVRDALICPSAGSIRDLPKDAIVGTASIRREAFLRHYRPDLRIVLFRGNVQTRLRKLNDGEAAATLLAAAGLKRLGLESHIAQYIPTADMLPAPAQGAIGIEIRIGDHRIRDFVAPIHHGETGIAIDAERAFLCELDGSCRTPIAAYAQVAGGNVSFEGIILMPDGSQIYETARTCGAADAKAMGIDAAKELLKRGGNAVFRNVA